MFEKLKEMQIGNKIVSLLDRPIILGHDVDKHDKVINYILLVTGSVKYPGKSFELTLSKSQYLLFLSQRLNKRRFVKLIGAILVVLGLVISGLPLIYLGGALSLVCDAIWLAGRRRRKSILAYAIAYILGLLVFGWHRGLFAGSAALILYIYIIAPYYFFELNPDSGLNIDKIRCLKRVEVKK